MSKLALEIPNWNPSDPSSITIPQPDGLRIGPGEAIPDSSLGGIISAGLSVTFYLAGFIMFIWFTWGVFRYILAEGKKEELSKAKNHMRWAIVGFLLFMFAFFLGPFVRSIFPQVNEFYGGKQIRETTTGP